MHTGLPIPEFFLDIGRLVRGRILVLIWDISKDEKSKQHITEDGWTMVSGTDPTDMEQVWGMYEGELSKEKVLEWVEEVVIKRHLVDFTEKRKKKDDNEINEKPNEKSNGKAEL